MEKNEKAQARKVMVVADPTRESAGALQYALSHVVLENDELILLHVGYPNSWRNTFSFLRRPNNNNGMATPLEGGGGGGGSGVGGGGGGGGSGGVGEVDFLEEMKQVCETSQLKIRVRLERAQIDAKDRAAAILNRSKMLGVELLIIGQRKSLSYALLGSYRRTGGAGVKALDTAEYLIENSKCTCVAVQKKGQNGGYLLNTKTHKNFWLLA